MPLGKFCRGVQAGCRRKDDGAGCAGSCSAHRVSTEGKSCRFWPLPPLISGLGMPGCHPQSQGCCWGQCLLQGHGCVPRCPRRGLHRVLVTGLSSLREAARAGRQSWFPDAAKPAMGGARHCGEGECSRMAKAGWVHQPPCQIQTRSHLGQAVTTLCTGPTLGVGGF